MAKHLKETDIRKKLKGILGWSIKNGEIFRTYAFSNFISAMAFVNHVADLAEQMDHHPDILIQYQKVTLTLSTHSAGGLTNLDFDLARNIDA